MLSAAPVIAFVAITDAERARAFYEQVLGLTLLGDEPAALVFDACGTMLRLSKVEVLSPAPYTVLGWSVADIRAEVEALSARDVTFERYGGLPQNDLGICSFPSGAQVAWFKDPDGNVLSLTQLD